MEYYRFRYIVCDDDQWWLLLLLLLLVSFLVSQLTIPLRSNISWLDCDEDDDDRVDLLLQKYPRNDDDNDNRAVAS